ncbi:uncharacterized protein [Centruroides vittatus]|uniref:uncharacterized protein n=1 Tax=Centruroides vittatus TaxID=120091 RepID=UPI00350FE9AA
MDLRFLSLWLAALVGIERWPDGQTVKVAAYRCGYLGSSQTVVVQPHMSAPSLAIQPLHCGLAEPIMGLARSNGGAGFVNPNNLDYFKFRGKKKGLFEQDEPARSGFGKSILKNHINPACNQVTNEIRSLYEISCDRFNSERLVEEKEDYELNNDVMGLPTNIKLNKGVRKHEDCTKNTNTIGYNIGYTIGYAIGCTIRDKKGLKKAGSFFKAVWKPVKRSVQKVWNSMKNGETEYVQFK